MDHLGMPVLKLVRKKRRKTRFYMYDDSSKIIYHSRRMPRDRHDLIFIGESDNPNVKMAAASFMQDGKVSFGFRLEKMRVPRRVKNPSKKRRPKRNLFRKFRKAGILSSSGFFTD